MADTTAMSLNAYNTLEKEGCVSCKVPYVCPLEVVVLHACRYVKEFNTILKYSARLASTDAAT